MNSISFFFQDYGDQPLPDQDTQSFQISQQTADKHDPMQYIINNLQLARFEIPSAQQIEGLSMTVDGGSCHKLYYFLARDSGLKAQTRKRLRGMVDVFFPSYEHDVSVKMAEQSVESGTKIDLNKALADFKLRFGDEASINLYVFCPFLKKSENKREFKFAFQMSENTWYQDQQNRDYLRDSVNHQIREANSGSTQTSGSDSDGSEASESNTFDLYEKVKNDIMNAENSRVLLEKVQNLKNYYGVTETEIDISSNLERNGQFVVQTVGKGPD